MSTQGTPFSHQLTRIIQCATDATHCGASATTSSTVEDNQNDRTLAEFLLMLDDLSFGMHMAHRNSVIAWDHVYRSLMKWRTTICNALVLSVRRSIVTYSTVLLWFALGSPQLLYRRKRLLSLAAQKLYSDIAADASQHARIRTNAQGVVQEVISLWPQAFQEYATLLFCSVQSIIMPLLSGQDSNHIDYGWFERGSYRIWYNAP